MAGVVRYRARRDRSPGPSTHHPGPGHAGAEGGSTILEALVALAIVSLTAVVILNGLTLAARSNMITNEQTTAETLARSQMEHVQALPYDSTSDPPSYGALPIPPAHTGYSYITTAVRLDPKGDGMGNDDGLQRVIVAVQRDANTLYTLESYKMER